jgi:1-aminocyclopropane-1-carboxylate deaminase
LAKLLYTETPVIEIKNALFDRAGIRVIIKREDLNHPFVSGNKWWKLRLNLEVAASQGFGSILTFGGAYSNHIYSTSAAANELGLKSIGIIRGEEVSPLNRTLAFAKDQGMELHFISRDAYRKKESINFIEFLRTRFGAFYLIPEGGTNELAVRSCEEFAIQKLALIDFDYLCLPIGTGGTMAGIIAGFGGRKTILGISVLKNGAFLGETISGLLLKTYSKTYGNWQVLTSYDQGGYAKVTPSLINFIEEMNIVHQLPLDEVYTGKLLLAVVEEAKAGAFTRGSTVLVVHTGGLQGRS